MGIERTADNADIAKHASVGKHQPTWETGECPSCGSAPCGPHPDWLICKWCEDDWPCHVAQTVAAELGAQARDLYRRSDNVPLSPNDSSIERVGTLRDIADKLSARASALRGEG